MGSRGRIPLVVVSGWESAFELWMHGWVSEIESANGFEDARSGGLVVHLGRKS